MVAMGLWRPPCTGGGGDSCMQGVHGPSAVVILQRVHVLFRLFPGSPKVAVVDFCCGVFPRGKVQGVMDLCFYVYFDTPPDLCF